MSIAEQVFWKRRALRWWEKKHFIKDENVGDACDKKLMFGILSTLLNAHCSAGEEPDHGDQDKAHPHPGLDCACAAR